MAHAVLNHLVAPLVLARAHDIRGTEHLPKTGGFIVTPNHVSYIEPLIINLTVLRATGKFPASLTKQEVARAFAPLRNWLRMIPVYRKSPAQSLTEAARWLRNSQPVCVFPEGHRNWTDTLLLGRTGAARLALETGVPIVPVGYIGPHGRSTGEALRNFFSQKTITMHFGEPITFDQYQGREITKETLYKTTDYLMERIGVLCGKKVTPHGI